MPVSCEGYDNVSTNVYDRILKEPREKIWLEGGFTVAGDAEWVSVPIQLADFNDAVVFVSLPAIPRMMASLAIARVHNVVSSGRCPLRRKCNKPTTVCARRLGGFMLLA